MKARCISLFIAAAVAFPPTTLAAEDLEGALDAYERSRYAESMQLLRPAAAGGDLRAQEMLGFMHLYGPALYGAQVPRDPDQARYWLQRAAAAGSPVAALGLKWIEKRTALTDASIGAGSRLK